MSEASDIILKSLENAKVEMVKASENLADQALSGDVGACLIITRSVTGAIQLTHVGMSPVEALGSMQVASTLLMGKIMDPRR